VLTNKYNFKENEAQALSDFMMPMLEYYPEKRASARQMLNHPWLKMPANFDYKMSDLEIEKRDMIENTRKSFIPEKKKKNENEYDKDREIISSDSELNEADDEDNDKNVFSDKSSLFDDESESGDENPDKINIQNFNNSFAQYGQFVDLSALDKENPQFDLIMKKD
jgi:serine/threonine-protein kinase SRPK3